MSTITLKHKVLHSVGWTFSSQVFRELFQFAVTVIMARLLTPKDYGLVGMSASVIGFIQIFNTMGFRSALIQKQEVTDDHFSTAFWSTLGVSLGLYLIVLPASPLVAVFFREPLLKGVIAFSALGLIISSLNTIQFARLEKNMDFKSITMVELGTALVSGTVSISLALGGYGVWSIVWGPLIGQFLLLPAPWIITGWRPAFRFSTPAFRELFGFGAHLTGATVVNYFARNADNLIIGRVLGASALGYYALAYNLMLKPLGYISSNVGRVLFPAFSSIRGEKEKTRNAYLQVVQFISLITFPMMAGLLFVAPELIEVIYGTKWLPVVPILQVLCLLGAIQSIGTTVGIIYMSQGRADMQFKYALIFVPIIVTSFIVGVNWGVIGVAVGYVISSGSIWIWSHVVANRLIELAMPNIFKKLFPAFAASMGMYIVLFAVFVTYPGFPEMNHTLLLTLQVLTGAAAYLVVLSVLDKNIFKELLDLRNRGIHG